MADGPLDLDWLLADTSDFDPADATPVTVLVETGTIVLEASGVAEPMGMYSRTDPFDIAALQATITSLPRSVYRIKGFVNADGDRDRRYLLQAVGMRAEILPYDTWGHDDRATRLVVIADREETDHDDVCRQLDACQVAALRDGSAS